MGILKDLEKINKKTFSIFLLNLLLLITPGVTVLFLFHYNLYINLDFPKMFILTISLISPLLILNYLLGIRDGETIPQMSEEDTYSNLTFAIFISAFVLYLGIGIKYFLKLVFK